MRVLRDIPNHHAVHRHRDRDQCGIDQGKSTYTPDSKWFKYSKQCGGELVQQRYGSNNHEPSFYRLWEDFRVQPASVRFSPPADPEHDPAAEVPRAGSFPLLPDFLGG